MKRESVRYEQMAKRYEIWCQPRRLIPRFSGASSKDDDITEDFCRRKRRVAGDLSTVQDKLAQKFDNENPAPHPESGPRQKPYPLPRGPSSRGKARLRCQRGRLPVRHSSADRRVPARLGFRRTRTEDHCRPTRCHRAGEQPASSRKTESASRMPGHLA